MFSTPTPVDVNPKRLLHDRAQAPDVSGAGGTFTPLWNAWYYGTKNFEFETRTSVSAGVDAPVPIIMTPGVYHFNCSFRQPGRVSTATSAHIFSSFLDLYAPNGVQGTASDLMARNAKTVNIVDQTNHFYCLCPLFLDYYCPAGTIVWVHITNGATIGSNYDFSGAGHGLSITRLGSG